MTPQAFPDHAHHLVVFWAPKVACTSLADWFVNGVLKARGLGDFTQVETLHGTCTESQRTWLQQMGYTLSAYQGMRLVLDEGYTGVYVVRDPFRRVVSAYVDKFVNHHQRPILRFKDLHGVGQELYCQIRECTPREARADYRGITILEMLEYVSQQVERREAGESIHLNSHYDALVCPDFRRFQQQADTLCISQLESGETFALLNSITGVDYVPHRFNISHYGEPGLLQGVPERSSLDLAAQDTLPHPSHFHTPEVRALVERA